MCTMPCWCWDLRFGAKGASIDPWQHGRLWVCFHDFYFKILQVLDGTSPKTPVEQHITKLQRVWRKRDQYELQEFLEKTEKTKPAWKWFIYCRSSYAFRVSLRRCQFTTSGLETLHRGRIRLLCPPISRRFDSHLSNLSCSTFPTLSSNGQISQKYSKASYSLGPNFVGICCSAMDFARSTWIVHRTKNDSVKSQTKNIQKP